QVDEIEHSGPITSKILAEIESHRFLIGDLTHERPNVYYEIGYAHGLGKEVILVAQETTDIHFDVAHFHLVLYKTLTELEHRLGKRLRAQMGADGLSD